jgi:phage baseplate assembly protein gpV
MIGDGDLEKFILNVVQRWSAGRYSERHALVTSYDPKNHLAKVTFMPEGQESGWLPIETGHIGNGYGIATGLQPGDGKTTGDQVIVRMQEGDFESGKIVQRVHSDQDMPPEVQSGETVIWTRFQKSDGGPNSAQGGQGGTGQKVYFKNDGSLTWTDGNGATLVADGQGNVTVTCKKMTVNASDDISITSQQTMTLTGQTVKIKDLGSDIITIQQGQVEIDSAQIVLNGETHLGGPGGVPAAQQGTTDTKGNADVGNLAQKVFVQ